MHYALGRFSVHNNTYFHDKTRQTCRNVLVSRQDKSCYVSCYVHVIDTMFAIVCLLGGCSKCPCGIDIGLRTRLPGCQSPLCVCYLIITSIRFTRNYHVDRSLEHRWQWRIFKGGTGHLFDGGHVHRRHRGSFHQRQGNSPSVDGSSAEDLVPLPVR